MAPSTIEAGRIADRRRYYVTMVAGAIAISYFDRQAISVAISAIQRNIPISQEQFSYLSTAFLLAYAAMYAGGGRLLDLIGTRRGFLLIMLWWSAACALHGLAEGFGWLVAMRVLLGMGEGGGFPAATRVVSEWVPARERSTAMGFINAGTAIGQVVAPQLIGSVILHTGGGQCFSRRGQSDSCGHSGGQFRIAVKRSRHRPISPVKTLPHSRRSSASGRCRCWSSPNS